MYRILIISSHELTENKNILFQKVNGTLAGDLATQGTNSLAAMGQT